jgi:hypothetical protein
VIKKKGKLILDTRDLKILSVKRAELKDAVVFIVGTNVTGGKKIDRSAIMKLAEHLQTMEPDSVYFPVLSEIDIQIYSMDELKHQDLLVVVRPNEKRDTCQVELQVSKALSKAKSITFIHEDINIKRK